MCFLLIYTLIGFFQHTSAVPFPAKKFFNAVNETDEIRGNYLCQVKYPSKKCCNCDKSTCYENCCIDVFWDSNFYDESDLDFYLENFEKLHNEQVSAKSCQPIKEDNSRDDFKIDYIFVKSFAPRANGKIDANCLNRKWKNGLMPVVFHKDHGFYLNKECAESDQVKDSKYLNISVKCQIATNLTNEMIFNHENEKYFENCQFHVNIPENTSTFHVERCHQYVDDCDENNENYNLCKMYTAPTNGYKNKHCLKCNQDSTRFSLKLEKSCPKTEESKGRYNYHFILSFDQGINNFIVTSVRKKFPTDEFFGNLTYLKSMFNPHVHLCDTVLALHNCYCFCEPSCFKYRMCCMDIFWDEFNPIDIYSYKKLLIDQNKESLTYECTTIFPSLHQSGNGEYYLVTSCDPFSNEFDKSKCYNIKDSSLRINTPVIGNDKNIYRNLYCARCNFIKKYIPTDLIVVCPLAQNLDQSTDLISKNDCFYHISVDFVVDYSILKCVQKDEKEKRTCDNKNHPYYELCHAYTAMYGNYKNLHCYLCSSTNEISFKPCLGPKFVATWSLLISFSDDVSPLVVKSYSHAPLGFCEDADEFGIGKKDCTTSSILLDAVNTSNPSFKTCLALQKPSLFLVEEKQSKTFGRFNWKQYLIDLQITDYEKVEYFDSTSEKTSYLIKKLSYEKSIDILSYYHVIKDVLGESTLVLSTVDKPIISDIHNLDFLHTFPNNRVCYQPFIILNQSAIEYQNSCGMLFNGIWYNASDIVLLNVFKRAFVEQKVVICKKFYMSRDNCQLKLITKDIKIKEDGSFIYSQNDKKKVFPVESFFPTVNGVAICLFDDFVQEPNLLYQVEIFFSLIGCSVSILCYIAVLLTYCIFKTLQNTPGKNTMSLTLCLLIGDTMYLLAAMLEKKDTYNFMLLCKSIAILMHFFLVNAYVWTIAISYDIMLTFSRPIFLGKTRNYTTYFVVTTLSTVVIIVMAITLDDTDVLKTGYGDGGICVPHKYDGRVLFFVTPIAISIFISFSFLVKTIWSMASQTKYSKRLKHRNSKSASITLVALKLLFVLGIPELIGLLQVISRKNSTKMHQFNNVIGFIYTITRSLRGVFIFFVYIIRDHVLNLYRMSKFYPFNLKRKMDDTSTCRAVQKTPSTDPYVIESQL